MASRIWTVLMLAPLAAVVAMGHAGEAAAKPKDKPPAAKAEVKAEKKTNPGKPVRIQPPPKPGVQTVVAPGTWKVHRHRGNSPLFKMGREKEWVDHPGPGKRPVIKRHDSPGKGKGKGKGH